jgi:AraC-like DNA-binding protein
MSEQITSYRQIELQRGCQQVTRLVKSCTLAGRKVALHRCFPVYEEAGWYNREHAHSFYEAHMLLSGAAEDLTGPIQTVGPGSVLLHAPFTPHTWHAPAADFLRITAWFTVTPPISLTYLRQWPVWPDLPEEWTALFADLAAQAPGWPDRVFHRTALILSRLLTLTDLPPTPSAPPPETESLLQLVDRFLEDNLTRIITRHTIASHLGMSERSLTRQMQRLAGESVMARLERVRLTQAMTLLRKSDHTIEAVGRRVGFQDPAYFTRRFRRHVGITPSVFRKRIR